MVSTDELMSGENPIRFRLVGAIILIVLAVIFLPWLLDGAGYEHMSGIEDPVPDVPTFVEPDIALPSEAQTSGRPPSSAAPAPERGADGDPAQLHSLENGNAETAGPAQGSARRPGSTTVERAAQGEAVRAGWAVQVGSYREPDNATEQESRLRDGGQPAFIDSAVVEGARIYRVKIGPLARREQAVELREDLQDEFGLSGIVVAHP